MMTPPVILAALVALAVAGSAITTCRNEPDLTPREVCGVVASRYHAAWRVMQPDQDALNAFAGSMRLTMGSVESPMFIEDCMVWNDARLQCALAARPFSLQDDACRQPEPTRTLLLQVARALAEQWPGARMVPVASVEQGECIVGVVQQAPGGFDVYVLIPAEPELRLLDAHIRARVAFDEDGDLVCDPARSNGFDSRGCTEFGRGGQWACETVSRFCLEASRGRPRRSR